MRIETAVSEPCVSFKSIHHEVLQQGNGNIKVTGDSKTIPGYCPVHCDYRAKTNRKNSTTSVLKEILNSQNPSWTPDDLLSLFSFTGGVAKYVQLLMDDCAYTKQSMTDRIIREDSLFLPEGKNMLIEEFGKEYATYFTILSAIARGENTRSKIEAIVRREVGGYLTKLERDYNLISKAILTFSGKLLERYFRTKLTEEKRFTRIGGYWDRKGETEIDLIAVNEIEEYAEFIEVKRNASEISLEKLREKSYAFIRATGELKDYRISHRGFSLNEM